MPVSLSPWTLPANPSVSTQAANKAYVDANAGGQTVNYAQPLALETFSPSAGSSSSPTLANTAYAIYAVTLNGQMLQSAEWSITLPGTGITITPADGAFVSGDKVQILYARAATFSGTFSDDIAFTNPAKGVIFSDRTDGHTYRLFFTGGVLSSEQVT